MLRILRVHVERTEVDFALQRLSLTDTSLLLRLSDGEDVYEGEFNADFDRPKSRTESTEEFMVAVEAALGTCTGKHLIQSTRSDSSLNFTVLEVVDSSTRLCLVKLSLKRREDRQLAMMEIFRSVGDDSMKMQMSLHRKEQEVQYLRNQAAEFSAHIAEAARVKEELQTEILSKVCLLLNEKKSEIRALRARVDELEAVSSMDKSAALGDDIDIPTSGEEAHSKVVSPIHKGRSPMPRKAPLPRGTSAVPRIKRNIPEGGPKNQVFSQILSSGKTEVLSGRDIISNPDIISNEKSVEKTESVDPSDISLNETKATTSSIAQPVRRRMRTMLDASDSD